MPECAVAVMAKAPIPGFAKTRLIPVLGADGAARLQERLIDRALATAIEARIGPVTLWCAPDDGDAFVRRAALRHDLGLAVQPGGDLGARMLAAFEACRTALVLIGTDCPILGPGDFREAAELLSAADVVIAPAEDGGYGLIGTRRPLPVLFDEMPWGSEQVAALTRKRAQANGVALAEIRTVWDVDTAADFERLRTSGLIDVTGLEAEPDAAR